MSDNGSNQGQEEDKYVLAPLSLSQRLIRAFSVLFLSGYEEEVNYVRSHCIATAESSLTRWNPHRRRRNT